MSMVVSATHRGIVKAHPGALDGLSSHLRNSAHLAAGFTPHPEFDMTYQGGRTIPKLKFKSFYLNGAKWNNADIANIDRALPGAMTDKPLNKVLLQYFPGHASISTKFLGSQKVTVKLPKTFTRDHVNPVLQSLLTAGKLKDVDNNTVVCLLLPAGVILNTNAHGGVGKLKGDDSEESSLEGLGGYHGSAHVGDRVICFAVGVYSQETPKLRNGIPFWPDPWKNIVATFYHELNEARTDPDVEEFNRTHQPGLIGWYADVDGGGEIGDIPMNEAGPSLGLVMTEVKLAAGGTAPIQLMWSNAVHGPQGPIA
jgi:hypothetical protein